MKLASTRLRDQDDLPALWPHAGFVSPEEAVAHLYEHAYPDLDPDPYLVQWLAGLVGGPAPQV